MNKTLKLAIFVLIFSGIFMASPSHAQYFDYGYGDSYYNDDYYYGSYFDDYGSYDSGYGYDDYCYNCGDSGYYDDYYGSGSNYGSYDYCGYGGCGGGGFGSIPFLSFGGGGSTSQPINITNTNVNNNNNNLNNNNNPTTPTYIQQPPVIITQYNPVIPTIIDNNACGASYNHADQYFTRYTDVNQTISFSVSSLNGNSGIERYALSLPYGASFSNSSGVFTWTPTQTGTYTAKFRIFRCTDNYSDLIVSIIVRNVVQPPIFYPPATPIITFNSCSVTNATAGQSYIYTVSARHNQNLPLRYSIVGPQGMTINQYTGVISWIPYGNQGGQTYPITVTASDGAYKSNCNFNVIVHNPPVISRPPVVPPAPEKPKCETTCACQCQITKDTCPATSNSDSKDDVPTCGNDVSKTDTASDSDNEDDNSNALLLAGILTLLGILFNPWFLLLVIIVLAFLLWRFKRDRGLEKQLDEIRRNAARGQLTAVKSDLPIIE